MCDTEQLIERFNAAFEADGAPEQGISDLDPGAPGATLDLALEELKARDDKRWTVTVKSFLTGRECHYELEVFLAANEQDQFIVNTAALSLLHTRYLVACGVYDREDPGDLCNIPFISLEGAGTSRTHSGLSVW